MAMLLFFCCFLQNDISLENKFKNEYPDVIKKWKEDSGRFEEVFDKHFEISVKNKGKRFVYSSYELGKLRYMETKRFPLPSKEPEETSLFCGNENYSFRIIKKNDQGQAILKDYEKDPKEDGIKIVFFRNNSFNELFFINRALAGDKNCQLKESKISNDLIATFVLDLYSDFDGTFNQEETIVCEPQNYWRVLKIVHKGNLGYVTVEDFKYLPGSQGLSYPTEIITTKYDTYPGGNVLDKSVGKIELAPISTKDRGVFFLTNYGFPEPADFKAPDSSRFYSFILLGLAIPISIILYILLRKRGVL